MCALQSGAWIEFGVDEDSQPRRISGDIWPGNDQKLTKIGFTTLATKPGPVTVHVYPKTCTDLSSCTSTASFTFLQIDDSLPELVGMIPSGGALQNPVIKPSLSLLKFPNVANGVINVTYIDQTFGTQYNTTNVLLTWQQRYVLTMNTCYLKKGSENSAKLPLKW